MFIRSPRDLKWVSALTGLAFALFTASCAFYKEAQKDFRTIPDARRGGLTILEVVTEAGDHIQFPKDRPGTVLNAMVVGETEKGFEIERESVKAEKRGRDGKIIELTTKEGTNFQVVSVREVEGKYAGVSLSRVQIPFSAIKMVRIKEFDGLATIVINVLAPILCIFLIFLVEPPGFHLGLPMTVI